jgi:hypothetical protein
MIHEYNSQDDAKDVFNRPFRYDGHAQSVMDADNNLVLDIRGWGYLSKLVGEEKAVKLQDKLGKEVSEYLNSTKREGPDNEGDQPFDGSAALLTYWEEDYQEEMSWEEFQEEYFVCNQCGSLERHSDGGCICYTRK